ncbi:MAG: hypothetical protein NVS1B2_23930 [Vulcanimicrobiaceae bacterium]
MKRAIAVAATAVVALLGYGIYDAGRDERPPPPANSDIKLDRGHATGQRVKFRSWSADYDRIVSNADQTVLDISGVRNGTIYRGGKPYLRVTANHMTVNTLTRNFSALGPIHAETLGSQPHRAFDTTSATWSDATQKLTLAHRVLIHSGADRPLSVGSLIFNVRSGAITIDDVDGPVRVR